ncbi:CDP-alcohol phosphatidyltransferase-domain-containing protein [Sporodiniella umbellata]|nr:CDP-alcohol phosphatidyltransferase-domain-containing protein [Sporodiniella umbellata]
MKPYIPQESISGLDRYRYGGVDKSLVSRYILTPYWSWLVTWFPLWMAPNLITLLGLSTVLFNIFTLFYYTSDLGPCPAPVYYTFGLGLFIYQSLDAIDGKQARRTGASGPLGELFDHGCDAINTSLGVILWASATGLGQSGWTLICLIGGLANFYLSTWEEYHTGVLYLGYFSGPVEGVLMMCSVHMISGYFGPEVWAMRVKDVVGLDFHQLGDHGKVLGYVQLNHLLVFTGAAVLLFNIVSGLYNVVKVKLHPTDTSHPDRSIGKACLGLFPFVSQAWLAYAWLHAWPDLVTDHLAWVIPLLGLLFSHQVGLMITAHVAGLAFPYVNWSVSGLLLSGVILSRYELAIEDSLYVLLDHRWVIKVYLVLAAAQYAHLVHGVIQQICDYLDIGCLYIKHPKKKQK